jgi:uncharacterized protein YbjT (DUF2867 family)
MATGAGGGGLDGTAAPVVGGTGKVGREVVRAFLRGGARVLVPSRGEAALDALRTHLGGGDGRSVPVASVQARRQRAGAPA